MTSSKGVVIFAYNSTFDYVKIANLCATLTNAYTGRGPGHFDQWPHLPVTLITDSFGALQADSKVFDNIIIHPVNGTNKRTIRAKHDSGPMQTINWKNLNRADVYDLTPYDQTLLLDCDYLMFSYNLKKLFRTDIEFTCHRDVYDITGKNVFQNDSRLSPYSVPMLWATVIYFRKSSFSKSIFDMMKLVQENYAYYAKVYGFKPSPFRNDFALSIAYHSMSGYGLDELLPYKLSTLSPMTDVVDFRSNGELLYQYKHNNKMYTGISVKTDLHIMNKSIFTDDIVERMLTYAKKR